MRMLTLALVLLCGGVARGEWLVDGPTFTQTMAGYLPFYEWNSTSTAIGMPFRIDQPHMIDTIMAHVEILTDAPAGSHFITTIQRNSAANLPGEELFASELSVPHGTRAVREIAVTGLALQPGDYWVTIGCPPGSEGRLISENQRVSFEYDLAHVPIDDVTKWMHITGDGLYPLLQVSGHAVPEPSCLTVLSLAKLAMMRKRPRRVSRPF